MPCKTHEQPLKYLVTVVGLRDAAPSPSPHPLHRVALEALRSLRATSRCRRFFVSTHISSAVWANPDIGGSAKLVLLKFADLSDDDGENAWPSVGRVSRECGMSERQVQRIIGALVRAGYLIQRYPANSVHPSATYKVVPVPRGDILSPPGDIKLSQMSPDPSLIRSSTTTGSDRIGRQSAVANVMGSSIRKLLWAAYTELTLKLIPPPQEEQQFDLWEQRGVTSQHIEEALAATKASQPDRPWPWFKTVLGAEIAKATKPASKPVVTLTAEQVQALRERAR